MTLRTELSTITSSMDDLAGRITALVETEGPSIPADLYTELVAAERTVGALVRRLSRVSARLA